MSKKFNIFIILLIALALFYSCEHSSTAVDKDKARLIVYLTDAPTTAYDSVVIYFHQVSAHIEPDWVHLNLEAQRVDLLEWSDGRTLVLGSGDVPPGEYSQVRLIIDSAKVVLNGVDHKLMVPSGAQTGLKFNLHFAIAEGATYELVADFDASRSVVKTGANLFLLKPVIRVASKALTGSISGTVTNPGEGTYAYAIQGTVQDADTVGKALVRQTDVYFILSFLPEGVYRVHVSSPGGLAYDQENITITAG